MNKAKVEAITSTFALFAPLGRFCGGYSVSVVSLPSVEVIAVLGRSAGL